jgi:hypothetical protein
MKRVGENISVGTRVGLSEQMSSFHLYRPLIALGMGHLSERTQRNPA